MVFANSCGAANNNNKMAATAQQKMAAAQTKMAARKRVVSECASIIADPTQVKQGQIQTRWKIKHYRFFFTISNEFYIIKKFI